ncbi:hypothetical protein SAMN05421819_2779 [Bryocella elongata]|uniref:Uncharacterized protein n=1 Tax=Bryocella elongata TaxID=863522 RepID=A0A1H5ZPB2_9BACT|nr:hypothetical protein SAMN05421819_2779 [Bryocella elongata]
MTRSKSTRKAFEGIVLLLMLLSAARAANGQGCSQCLDQTRATPASVQASYRHAIELMAGVAAGLFLAAAWMLRREP